MTYRIKTEVMGVNLEGEVANVTKILDLVAASEQKEKITDNKVEVKEKRQYVKRKKKFAAKTWSIDEIKTLVRSLEPTLPKKAAKAIRFAPEIVKKHPISAIRNMCWKIKKRCYENISKDVANFIAQNDNVIPKEYPLYNTNKLDKTDMALSAFYKEDK